MSTPDPMALEIRKFLRKFFLSPRGQQRIRAAIIRSDAVLRSALQLATRDHEEPKEGLRHPVFIALVEKLAVLPPAALQLWVDSKENMDPSVYLTDVKALPLAPKNGESETNVRRETKEQSEPPAVEQAPSGNGEFGKWSQGTVVDVQVEPEKPDKLGDTEGMLAGDDKEKP